MVLVPLVSGCLNTGPPNVAQVHLADFASCKFTYPDGKPVSCEDERVMMAVSGDKVPPGWVCDHGFSDGQKSYTFYWNPATNKVALLAGVPGRAGPVTGLLLHEGDLRLYSWRAPSLPAWIELPEAASSGPIDVEMHAWTMSATPGPLAGADLSERWSVFNGSPWVVLQVSASGHEYFFERMVENHLVPGAYHDIGFSEAGVDFNVTFGLWTTSFGAFGTASNRSPGCVGASSALGGMAKSQA